MEEQDVNNFSQSVIPEFATSVSAAVMPGIWEGVNRIVQGQANKAEQERRKNQEIASITEELDPEIVWEVDQEELLKFAEEKSGELTKEAMDKKYNMDELNYGDFAKKVKTTKTDLARKAKKAEENQKGFEKIQDDYEKQKAKGDDADFNLEKMKAWLDAFKNAKSIDERNAMLRDTDNTPYERNYTPLDLAKATMPKPSVESDEKGTRTFIDEEIWGNTILEYINSQDGEGYYEKFKNSGESPEAFSERMANRFVEDNTIVAEQFRSKRPPQSGGGGSGTKKVGFVANIEKATNPNMYSQTKAKNILYIKTPQGKPASSKAGVVRTVKDPKTGQPIVDPATGGPKIVTEQIIVNSAFYNTQDKLMVSIVRFKPGGEQTGVEEVVPYEDNKTDYDNYAGFKIKEKLDKAIEDEEAKLKGASTSTKPASGKTQSKAKNTGTGKFPEGFNPNK
jgi:hypothetical protein